MEATFSEYGRSEQDYACIVIVLCNLELCKGTKSYFCSAKNNAQLLSAYLFFINIDLDSWTLSVS